MRGECTQEGWLILFNQYTGACMRKRIAYSHKNPQHGIKLAAMEQEVIKTIEILWEQMGGKVSDLDFAYSLETDKMGREYIKKEYHDLI